MNQLLFVPLLAVTLLVVLIVGIVRLVRNRDLRTGAAGADLRAVERWTTLWRWVGALLGACLAVAAVAQQDVGLGRLALAAPAIAGCSVLLAIMVGEWTIRPSSAQRRTASLTSRSFATLVPRARIWGTATGIATLSTLLGVGMATASPDDQGRAGRALTATCVQDLPGIGSTVLTATNGPWPGSYYALPAALIMLATIGFGIVAARAIRDRANPDSSHAAYDTHLRRDAMRRVVSAIGATAWGTAGPIAIVMSSALHGNGCVTGGDPFAGAALLIALISLVIAMVLTATVLLPARAPEAAARENAAPRARS